MSTHISLRLETSQSGPPLMRDASTARPALIPMLGPLPKMSEDTYLASEQWLRGVVAHVSTAVAPRRHE